MIDAGAPLTRDERDAFLRLGVTARLACLDAEGWPYVVPVWHHWDGEQFWVIGAKRATWARHLLADPRVALCVDEPPTLTRVVCQGEARHVEGPSATGRWVGVARTMAARYLGVDAVPAYEAATRDLERLLFVIEARRLVSCRGPGRAEGEPTRRFDR